MGASALWSDGLLSRLLGAGGRVRQDAALAGADEDAAALLRAIAAGDRRALRRLYETEAGRLHAIALQILRDASLASDVLHDAFLSVWRNAAQFDPERGGAAAWLTGIVRTRALDIARRIPSEVDATEVPEVVEETQDALFGAARRQEETALHDCLGALEEARRELIVVAFLGGLTHAEAAQHSGLPVGTVKSHIRRGLLALRACLEGREQPA